MQDSSLSASRWCSIEPAVRRWRMRRPRSAFAFSTVSKSPTSLRTSYSGREEGKAQGSRARASLAVVVVFFIVFSSGKWRRGGHRRPPFFHQRRARSLLAPVNGAVRSNESIRTGPGWRSVAAALLFFTGLGYRRRNSNLAAVGRVQPSAMMKDSRPHMPRAETVAKETWCAEDVELLAGVPSITAGEFDEIIDGAPNFAARP